MAYYLQFKRKVKTSYRDILIDINEIEFCEHYDEKHFKIFMKSGNKVVILGEYEAIEDLLMEVNDEYGRIMGFSNN